MIGPLTYLDAALLAISFISGLLAMYRGFTRELLSIVSWAIAGGAVLYFVLFHKQFAKEMADQMGAQLPIAQIVIGAIVFLIVLIVVHLITARISDAILDSRVGMIDRVLGFAFGVVRGFILIVIPYMFYEAFFPEPKQQLEWVREAKSLPYIKSTGNGFRNILVRYIPSQAAPTPTEQQGSISPAPKEGDIALANRSSFHISVTWNSDPDSAGTDSAGTVSPGPTSWLDQRSRWTLSA
ncbi:MAG: CvpA family protein [Hyphomicrobium sp.]